MRTRGHCAHHGGRDAPVNPLAPIRRMRLGVPLSHSTNYEVTSGFDEQGDDSNAVARRIFKLHRRARRRFRVEGKRGKRHGNGSAGRQFIFLINVAFRQDAFEFISYFKIISRHRPPVLRRGSADISHALMYSMVVAIR